MPGLMCVVCLREGSKEVSGFRMRRTGNGQPVRASGTLDGKGASDSHPSRRAWPRENEFGIAIRALPVLADETWSGVLSSVAWMYGVDPAVSAAFRVRHFKYRVALLGALRLGGSAALRLGVEPNGQTIRRVAAVPSAQSAFRSSKPLSRVPMLLSAPAMRTWPPA